MKISTDTSKLLDYRAREIVPDHLEKMKQAVTDKDWKSLCELTMKESNSLHACCLDTYPPIFYMNETTKSIISLVHDINKSYAEPVAAYTVDAGANCFLITKKSHLLYLLGLLQEVSGLDESNIRFAFKDSVESEKIHVDEFKIDKLLNPYKGKVNLHQIIVTRIGKGAHIKN